MLNRFLISVEAMKFENEFIRIIFRFVSVNTSGNITESEYWSRTEKSVLAPILTAEMVLGVLGNGLVLIVKVVVRIIYHFIK